MLCHVLLKLINKINNNSWRKNVSIVKIKNRTGQTKQEIIKKNHCTGILGGNIKLLRWRDEIFWMFVWRDKENRRDTCVYKFLPQMTTFTDRTYQNLPIEIPRMLINYKWNVNLLDAGAWFACVDFTCYLFDSVLEKSPENQF